MGEPRTIRQTIRSQPDLEVIFSRTLAGERLVKFRIQLRAKVGLGWQNVLRYDHNARPGPSAPLLVGGEPVDHVGPFTRLEEALQWCLEDLERSAGQALESAKASYTRKVNIDGESP